MGDPNEDKTNNQQNSNRFGPSTPALTNYLRKHTLAADSILLSPLFYYNVNQTNLPERFDFPPYHRQIKITQRFLRRRRTPPQIFLFPPCRTYDRDDDKILLRHCTSKQLLRHLHFVPNGLYRNRREQSKPHTKLYDVCASACVYVCVDKVRRTPETD